MFFKPVILWTDALLFGVVLTSIVLWVGARKSMLMQTTWRQLSKRSVAMASMLVFLSFFFVGVLDSVHFRTALPNVEHAGSVYYSTRVKSVLDEALGRVPGATEKTYSSPFASELLGAHRPGRQLVYVRPVSAWQFVLWSGGAGCLALLLFLLFARRFMHPKAARVTFVLTGTLIVFLVSVLLFLSHHYHIFGTDKVGQDVFYQAVKSIRTALIVGTVTTLTMLPLAIGLGVCAGFFGGVVDDVIQYVYTTVSSVPGILLISAVVLSLHVFISLHPNFFPTLSAQADARLLSLCLVLGLTGWTPLCRLLRGEVFKLREMDFVTAARALGVKRRHILMRHVLPNLMHIVLITVALDFSGLVLAEVVLTYVGVGVDPTTLSWGNMINSARLELARDPVVWWPLLAAFLFMFPMVLSANLFADALRDALDPRLREA